MAMNMFSQGVDPELDFREMRRIKETVEAINKLPVHERHPYAGELVFTAFSGSHQDAIRKGMAQVDVDHWEVPYLPIDPADVGSSYKETVRVNSQSGKGGVGFILEEFFGVSLPREMLVEFSKVVQALTERLDREVKPDEIFKALLEMYAVDSGPYRLVDYDLSARHAPVRNAVPRASKRPSRSVDDLRRRFRSDRSVRQRHRRGAERTAEHHRLSRARDVDRQGRASDLSAGDRRRRAGADLRNRCVGEHDHRVADGDHLGDEPALGRSLMRSERSVAEHLDLHVVDHVVLDLQRLEQVVADSQAEVRLRNELEVFENQTVQRSWVLRSAGASRARGSRRGSARLPSM